MSAYGVILVAVGVVAITWLLANNYTGTARAIWEPIAKLSLTFRIAIALLTFWVLFTAGGIATGFAIVLLAFLTLHFVFTRPDEDLGVSAPGPLRWVTKRLNRLSKTLFGT